MQVDPTKHDPRVRDREATRRLSRSAQSRRRCAQVTYVTKNAPPLLPIQSDKDQHIPCTESTNLQTALKKTRGYRVTSQHSQRHPRNGKLAYVVRRLNTILHHQVQSEKAPARLRSGGDGTVEWRSRIASRRSYWKSRHHSPGPERFVKQFVYVNMNSAVAWHAVWETTRTQCALKPCGKTSGL